MLDLLGLERCFGIDMSNLIRKREVLRHIQTQGALGLEIGPGCSPILNSNEANIKFCDHLDQQGLIKKYENDPAINKNRIPYIDYVWGDKSLIELVGPNLKFDYVIASHVIEHVPDLVSWLNEIHQVLKPNGILSLVVPDKRYTFDFCRQTSKFSDVLAAYIEKRKRPSISQIIDHFSEVVTNNGLSAWSSEIPEELVRRTYSDQEAFRVAQAAHKDGGYVDVHGWVFTQESLVTILWRLSRLGLLNYEVVNLTPTNFFDCEFYLSFRAHEIKDELHEKSIFRREESLIDAAKRLGVRSLLPDDTVHSLPNETSVGTARRRPLSIIKRNVRRLKSFLTL